MGDYMARNAPKFNSFTKFEVKLDLLSIEHEAYKKASKFFDDFEEDDDYTVTFRESECYPEKDTDKAQRQQNEKDEKIQEFMDGYTIFDQQFWVDYNNFLFDLDILYEDINKNKEFDE